MYISLAQVNLHISSSRNRSRSFFLGAPQRTWTVSSSRQQHLCSQQMQLGFYGAFFGQSNTKPEDPKTVAPRPSKHQRPCCELGGCSFRKRARKLVFDKEKCMPYSSLGISALSLAVLQCFALRFHPRSSRPATLLYKLLERTEAHVWNTNTQTRWKLVWLCCDTVWR